MMQRTESTHEKGRDSLSLSSVCAPLRRGCFFPDGTPLSTPMIPSMHSLLMESGTERIQRTGRGSEDRHALRCGYGFERRKIFYNGERRTGWGFPALRARRGEFRRSPRPDGINNVKGLRDERKTNKLESR